MTTSFRTGTRGARSGFSVGGQQLLQQLRSQTQASRYARLLREGTQRTFTRFVARPSSGSRSSGTR
jgi:hypothetical protein